MLKSRNYLTHLIFLDVLCVQLVVYQILTYQFYSQNDIASTNIHYSLHRLESFLQQSLSLFFNNYK